MAKIQQPNQKIESRVEEKAVPGAKISKKRRFSEEKFADIKRRVKKRPSPEEVQRLKQLGNDVMDQVDRLRLQDMWDTPALKTARRIRALDKADAVHKIIVQLTKLILTQYVSLKKYIVPVIRRNLQRLLDDLVSEDNQPVETARRCGEWRIVKLLRNRVVPQPPPPLLNETITLINSFFLRIMIDQYQ